MKNYYTFFSVLLGLIIASCSKSNVSPENKNTGELYKVSFTTQGFSQAIGTLENAKQRTSILDDSLKKYVPKLYCQIYKFSEENPGEAYLVYSTTQLSSDPNFGTIDTAFSMGSYVAVFVGSGHIFYPLAGLGSGSMDAIYSYSHFNTLSSITTQNTPVDQIFYKKTLFTVTGQPVNQTVSMQRIVAGLQVIITDDIPPNVTNIELTVDDTPMYSFMADARSGNANKITGFYPQQTTNKKLSMYVLANESRTVTLRAYAVDIMVAEKSVNCAFYTNRKTTLQGKLFTSDANFSVTVDPSWGTPGPTIPF